jgi:NADH dehydrogenase
VVFGRGDNPINFVSVADVAVLVERAITDPATRGETFEIGGPDNLTFNNLAGAVQAAAGRDRPPRHVPSGVLHVMAATIGRVKPELGRQARAALAMDRIDLTFDAAPIHRVYNDLPLTSATELLSLSTV